MHATSPRQGYAPAMPVLAVLALAVLGLLPGAAPARDPRTVEILRYGCSSEFGRREVTLFGNGTVRLREGPWEDQGLYLNELTPEALDDNLRVLRGAYSERPVDQVRDPVGQGPSGVWTDRCQVHLALPELEKPLRYEFSALDTLPLRISRLIHIAEELALYVRPIESEERLPADYEPRFGDVLLTAEGTRFQVLRLTTDRRGVEIQGVDEPIRIYVALDDLDKSFVAFEREKDRAWWWRQ